MVRDIIIIVIHSKKIQTQSVYTHIFLVSCINSNFNCSDVVIPTDVHSLIVNNDLPPVNAVFGQN